MKALIVLSPIRLMQKETKHLRTFKRTLHMAADETNFNIHPMQEVLELDTYPQN